MLLTRYNCIERIDALSLGVPYIRASNLERSGWIVRGIPNPETVAQHQIGAALMVTGRFRGEITALGLDIISIQDTLLIHDLAEPDTRVQDRTPHDEYDPVEHRRNEEIVIREILAHRPHLIELWLDYEDGRTPEGKFAMEIDKLQAIRKAKYYQDKFNIPGLVNEFYTHSVIKRMQIQTDFLLQYVERLHTSL